MALTSTHKSDIQPVENSMATIRERWIGSMFEAADKDKKGYISEKSAVRLICELNPRLTVNRVKQKVKVCPIFSIK
jgi:Ca2+-binding EF-hand superfamily protein